MKEEKNLNQLKYDTNYIFNKIFTFAKDNVYTDERQFSIVNLIQDNTLGYTNEYSIIETYPRLGFYDYGRALPMVGI